MKKLVIIGLAALTLGLAGCETPGERAAGGALIGAGAGALLGSAVTGGRSGGAWAGAAIGGVSGAIIGAETAPRASNCGIDGYGRRVCYGGQQVYAQPRPVRCEYDYYGRRVCYR